MENIVKATIQSIQTGRIQSYQDDTGKEWTSAVDKSAVDGPVQVTRLGIEGDEQADLKHHGGADKAVLAYSEDHFSAWCEENTVGTDWNLRGGSFGEKLTVADQTENDVCIGDIYRIGTCHLQVSQPRQPCWKLSRRWKMPKLAVTVQKTGRTGWYFRVLKEGEVQTGDTVDLLERIHPEWTVARAHRVMHAKPRIEHDDLQLAECQSLSESWSSQLRERVLKKQQKSNLPRLFGEQ